MLWVDFKIRGEIFEERIKDKPKREAALVDLCYTQAESRLEIQHKLNLEREIQHKFSLERSNISSTLKEQDPNVSGKNCWTD
uniref:Uncharacterized protein n=1 Tax=Cucumis melo TaxID=3656 RepID=A0A9I9EAT2_CUCME